MKVTKPIPANSTLAQQVELLKKVVLIKHDDFDSKSTGIIVSLLQTGMYWVLLDVPFKTKAGDYSRRRMFKPDELRLLE